MDHFALPDDALAIASARGVRTRNSTGATARSPGLRPDCAQGVGNRARGRHVQPERQTLDDYYDRLSQGHLPVVRGQH